MCDCGVCDVGCEEGVRGEMATVGVGEMGCVCVCVACGEVRVGKFVCIMWVHLYAGTELCVFGSLLCALLFVWWYAVTCLLLQVADFAVARP